MMPGREHRRHGRRRVSMTGTVVPLRMVSSPVAMVSPRRVAWATIMRSNGSDGPRRAGIGSPGVELVVGEWTVESSDQSNESEWPVPTSTQQYPHEPQHDGTDPEDRDADQPPAGTTSGCRRIASSAQVGVGSHECAHRRDHSGREDQRQHHRIHELGPSSSHTQTSLRRCDLDRSRIVEMRCTGWRLTPLASTPRGSGRIGGQCRHLAEAGDQAVGEQLLICHRGTVGIDSEAGGSVVRDHRGHHCAAGERAEREQPDSRLSDAAMCS